MASAVLCVCCTLKGCVPWWQELFDPNYVLNPGVILNRDMDVHRKHLKPSPKASGLVDRCIECGFCESNCPAKDLSLTPRQVGGAATHEWCLLFPTENEHMKGVQSEDAATGSRWRVPSM